MKINDILIAAIFLILAVTVVVSAQGFPPSPGQPVGPALFPTVVGICLGLASLLLLVRSFRATGARVWIEATPDLRHPRTLLSFVLAPVSVIFYLVASESIGFLPCAVLILAVLFTAFGVRLRLGLPLAVVASLAIYFLFSRVLAVPLPGGLLEGIV